MPRSTSEIRSAYLEFFKSKGHAVIPGSTLVPENDPTVLFTTAGMHPLVPYLLGEPHPAGSRLANVQRCVRTQDIDEVGDASHLTFFEMLGNWSLGNYFKEEAIEMSFEFLSEILGLPIEKLAITCFAGDKDAPRDNEAKEAWISAGIPPERIGFLPKKDNWWGPAGQTGPCGPDTEMFYWTGRGKPTGNPETHPDGWLEIWNDVFMQYDRQPHGTGFQYARLSQKNVDTGMGLERVAQIMQGTDSVYEIDVMEPIFDKVLSLSSKTSAEHARIITDHIRAATFITADGVAPSNVDRGYVLRRLIRRAVRSGRQIGIERAFCALIADIVIGQFKDAYPHMSGAADNIKTLLSAEEEQFLRTLNSGIKHFEKTVRSSAGGAISGQSAFHLYDTYGFPLEMTKEMAAEIGMSVDDKGFKKAFENHQSLSRAGARQKFAGGLADNTAETTKLHTATHLLNAALRKVLGNHVRQKGSNITQERLRFDFNHHAKVTKEQLEKIERLVNDAIEKDMPVSYSISSAEEAKKGNAIGVFGERYGKEVKVYTIGDGTFSKEICGGPHVARTGMIGLFKIIKEESSSSGVRRIKAKISGGAKEIKIAQQS